MRGPWPIDTLPAAAQKSLRLYAGIFILGLFVRALVGFLLMNRAVNPEALEFPDEQQYWLMARSTASGEGLRDELGFRATRMPLYPALLSIAAWSPRGILIVKGAQWVLGALQAVIAAALAARFGDRKTAFFAGLAVAFDPFLIFFSTLLLTETLFTTFVLMAFLLVAGPKGVRDGNLARAENLAPEVTKPTGSHPGWGWGLAMTLTAAAALYTRESAVLLLLTLLGWFVIRHRADRRKVTIALFATVLTAISLLPWAVRNRRTMGEWCILTTRGGISLYDGVGPQATGASDLGDIKQMPAVRGLGEGDWNRYFMAESMRAIRTDPMRILRLAVIKLKRTWNPWPNEQNYRAGRTAWVAGVWTIPTFVLAACGACLLLRRNSNGAWMAVLLLLPAAYVTLLHGVFVGSVRYRIPAMPFVDILAAVAVAALADKVIRRRSASRAC